MHHFGSSHSLKLNKGDLVLYPARIIFENEIGVMKKINYTSDLESMIVMGGMETHFDSILKELSSISKLAIKNVKANEVLSFGILVVLFILV